MSVKCKEMLKYDMKCKYEYEKCENVWECEMKYEM
jgi:hypothetical protein